MNREQLIKEIKIKNSFLCVGLDPDVERIPAPYNSNISGIKEFLYAIIDNTRDLCVAYKPNNAFFEVFGVEGWQLLKDVIDYIGNDHFIIADAKRGDIGNTSKKYAQAFFYGLNADAVTVAPYMGIDSVLPFLEFEDKWTILLGLTSNKGSQNFQFLTCGQNEFLFEKVLEAAKEWGTPQNLMFVIGATQASSLRNIRKILPESFLLVPGIGAQGGDINEVCKFGLIDDIGLLINSSRSILYASSDSSDFAQAAREKALFYQQQMEVVLKHQFIG